jgi:LmbE family N-acetylglucosaminyl deacetylase
MRIYGLAGMAVSAVFLTSNAPIEGQGGNEASSILAVVAHPDDELVMAPVIANLARNGSRVTIVYATSGDAGPGVSGMDKGEALALMREQEAQCAAQALGANAIFLRFGDGTLAKAAGQIDSTAAKLRAKLREEIRELRPQVVMSWGPDGGYGHPDHRMTSAIVTEVLQEMNEEERPRLFYAGVVKGRIPDETPFGLWAGTDPSLLNVRYRYDGKDIASSHAATQCHKTQFDEATRAALMPFFDKAAWQGEITFREAF